MKPTKERADKKPYASPTVTVLGDIETITLGSSDGSHLDASFPVLTFRGDLTFS